jgi:hypothetical protein
VWAETTIPSVQEILVVHSEKMEAEFLRRQAGGSWPEVTQVISAKSKVTFNSIGLTFPLREVYKRTRFVKA